MREIFEDLSSRGRKKLGLDSREGLLGGVCAGLARYLSIQPSWIRVGALVAGIFFPKLVVAAYLVAWLMLDERNRPDDRAG